ncbi:PP0621 family protein [Marinospirillum sp.]|uniref:PP0621 family protein n=1 Tax=Marinospirillum sp. TaxID=2183934 RepID=UPI003A8653F8
MSLLIVRLVVFMLLFWAGWQLWRVWERKQGAGQEHLGQEKKPHLDSESMVRCAQCGVHLPESSALHAEPYHFCCKEHQKAFEADQ